MERLTEWDEYGNADIIALSDVMPELYAELSFSETNALTDALNRLAEYEDTGLTPEEIADLRQAWDMYGGEDGITSMTEELRTYRNLSSLPHLCDMVEAERDGQLVALPCKVGDTVYIVIMGRIFEKQVFSIVFHPSFQTFYCAGTSARFFIRRYWQNRIPDP